MSDSYYDRWERDESATGPVDALQSIDRSLKIVKHIAVWFLGLLIIGLAVGLMAASGRFG